MAHALALAPTFGTSGLMASQAVASDRLAHARRPIGRFIAAPPDQARLPQYPLVAAVQFYLRSN